MVKMLKDLKELGEDCDPLRVLELCGITPDGLSDLHTRYLRALFDNGGRMGADNLAMLLSVNKGMLKSLESLFVTRGLIEWSGAGRELTGDGYARVSEMRQFA